MESLEYQSAMAARARQHFEYKRQMELLREKVTRNLIDMEEHMDHVGATMYETVYDETHDLYIQIKPHSISKLNKEKLAIDLGVSQSELKTPFLLSCVENRSLTSDKYEQYIIYASDIKLHIKKKKRKKPRSKKKKQNS
jgi:hypothetical protein